MVYIKWNNVITKYFFNETKTGKEVLLYVNDEVINSLGEPFGVGVDDFIDGVKNGPGWTTRTGFCQNVLLNRRIKKDLEESKMLSYA